MRDRSVLRKLLGLCVSTVVVVGRELVEGYEGGRDRLDVWVRTKVGAKGRCGKCGATSLWFDNGGGERRWRHVDVCFEFEYKRHGTAVLFAALDVHDGGIAGWVTDSTRSENFVDFLGDLVRQTPKGLDLHCIADNLSAHKTGGVATFLEQSPVESQRVVYDLMS